MHSETGANQCLYTSGQYLGMHPTWHVEESPWKVRHIAAMLRRNALTPRRICEIGSGAGEVLRLLQEKLPRDCTFSGYDISPQAFELSKAKANDRLHFKLGDFAADENSFFDLALVLDVIEHVEDYFSLLRRLKTKSRYKIFQVPLEISVQGVLRGKIFLNTRDMHGHLHPFTKETFLRTLQDLGYNIIDHAYAPEYEMNGHTQLIDLLRRLSLSVHKDWTARILGGCRILVLAE
jgi:hypothetical protein